MTSQLKLSKLAKNLNKFSFDELLIISEESEDAVKAFLDESVENNNIRQVGEDQFVFISLPDKLKRLIKIKPKAANKVFNPKSIEDIINPITQKNEYKIFMNEPEYSQRKILKYLLIFKAARDLKGNALINFIKLWNKRYPDYQTSLTSFILNKKKYLKDGIEGIIKPKPYNSNKSEIPDDLYYRFRELYLSPKGLSAEQCLVIINQENPDLEFIVPSRKSFSRRLSKEFSTSEIEYYRTMPMEMPEFIKKPEDAAEKTQAKNPLIKRFKEAGKHFLESDYCKNLKPSTFLSYKGYVENQLIPYFYKTPLNDITEEKVTEFKHSMLNEGLSTSTVNKYIDILIIIVNTYSNKNKLPDSVKFNNERNYYQDMRILEVDEVKKLLQTTKSCYPDFYPLLLTAVSTGMTRSELLALTWQDVLWNEKKIRVKKSLYKGEIVRHRAKNSVRNIDVSEDLIAVLRTWQNDCVKGKCDFIFPNSEGEAMDPDNMIKRRFMPVVKKTSIPPIRFIDLRDIYASLLIKQNLPLLYIQEQLGHSSPQVTAERYKFILEQNQIKKKNILEGVL